MATNQGSQHTTKESDVYEGIGGKKNPFTKNFTSPRLFVIKNDGTGYELLTKEQLDFYMRTMKHVSLLFF